jgi:flagellar L-ring protein precursor FlgH
MKRIVVPSFIVLSMGWFATPAMAQRSSIIHKSENGAISQATTSLIYSDMIQPKNLQLHDRVTIRVEELDEFISSGEISRRNNSTVDAQLKNWIELDGLNMKSASDTTLPRVRGNYNTRTTADGELNTKSKLAFNIQATIVDIMPNGNLVLEAHKTIRVDDEIVDNSISGIIRREDVRPDNTVSSTKLAESHISRRTVGHVRDSYKRGWLTKAWDNFSPF